MKSMLKRIFSVHILLICSVFLLTGFSHPTLTLINTTVAEEVFTEPQTFVMNDSEAIEKQEQQKLAIAITKVYRHVKLPQAEKLVQLVFYQAKQENISPTLLLGLISAESGFKQRAISKEGAVGYTQVNVKHHRDKIKGRDIYDARVNIEVGTTILSDCFKKHKTITRSLGCYNGTSNLSKANNFHYIVHKKQQEILHYVV